jgi:hypothetical protein
VPVPDDGVAVKRPVFVRLSVFLLMLMLQSLDVANGIIAALKDETSVGQVYEFFGFVHQCCCCCCFFDAVVVVDVVVVVAHTLDRPKKYTLREMLEYTFRTIHLRQRIISVPQPALESVLPQLMLLLTSQTAWSSVGGITTDAHHHQGPDHSCLLCSSSRLVIVAAGNV